MFLFFIGIELCSHALHCIKIHFLHYIALHYIDTLHYHVVLHCIVLHYPQRLLLCITDCVGPPSSWQTLTFGLVTAMMMMMRRRGVRRRRMMMMQMMISCMCMRQYCHVRGSREGGCLKGSHQHSGHSDHIFVKCIRNSLNLRPDFQACYFILLLQSLSNLQTWKKSFA